MIVLVTDPRYALDHILRTVHAVRDAIGDERFVVQHRDKSSSGEERLRARAALVTTGARIVVNGTPEEARAASAHGVHLPGPSPDIDHARAVLGDDAWVSIPAHDDAAVERAVSGPARATAVLVSPIFESPGKGTPRGVEALTRASGIARGRLAVVALGGVDSRRAASCFRAGADGIAVIRALFDAPDPAEAGRVALELARARWP